MDATAYVTLSRQSGLMNEMDLPFQSQHSSYQPWKRVI